MFLRIDQSFFPPPILRTSLCSLQVKSSSLRCKLMPNSPKTFVYYKIETYKFVHTVAKLKPTYIANIYGPCS